jgi:hypothetical protein
MKVAHAIVQLIRYTEVLMRTNLFAAAVAAAAIAASSVAAVHAEQKLGDTRANISTVSPGYSASLESLMSAAQQLRESIQTLAQQRPGAERDTALKAAREALYDTQVAMIQLPPHLRYAQSSGAVAPAYEESMRHLQQASDRLYKSLQAMAAQQPGPRRNAAIREAQEALFETHYAMVWLPNEGGSRVGAATDARRAATYDRSNARGTVSSRAASGAVAGGSHAATRASQDDVDALAGGVGVNARARLSNEATSEHNVKMVFSLNTGNYVADVNVKVVDNAGRTIVNGTAHGPWLYAKLPPGSYTVTASYRGESVTEKLSVGPTGQRTAHLRWPASVEQQAAGSAVAPILGTGPQETR